MYNPETPQIGLVVVLFANLACGQLVYPPLSLGTKSGMQIVNSTAEMSIGISRTSFIVNWILESTPVAQCSYFGTNVSCTISSPTYDTRLQTRFDDTGTIVLYLQIDPLLPSDIPSVNIVVELVSGSVSIIGNKTFQVVEDCVDTLERGVDSTPPVNSNLGDVYYFPCDVGYSGNATGVCQFDGTYNYTNNCIKVTCNTADLKLPEDCNLAFSGVVNYGKVLNLTCLVGEGKAVCETDGFQVYYVPVEVVTLPSGIYTSDVPLVGWVMLIFTALIVGIGIVLLCCYMTYRRWVCQCLPIQIEKK